MLSAKSLELFDYQALGQAVAYNLIKTNTMFDAIYSVYDEITFGIREVFLKFNIKVPEDVIIVSGGDCDFCNMFSPPMPIFIHDCDELAELAAEDLIKRIEAGEKTPGSSRNVGVVYQKIVEFDDIYKSRTMKDEVEINIIK
jgi:DNA-binding LacI/PurR family transcriptional regulator